MCALPECVQQVFSLKLFRLVFEQPHATFDVDVGRLDERPVRVHVVVQDNEADQHAQHEQVGFLFSELHGPVYEKDATRLRD